ncbi:MAG: putative signal transducing protein [Bacteroidales bacterium]
MDKKDWSMVFTTNVPYQAEIAKQMLGNNGIEAIIVDKQDSAYPSIGEAEIYVAKKWEEKAKKLIQDLSFE